MAASTFIFVFIGVSVVTTKVMNTLLLLCLLYTSDAADE